MTFLIIPIIWAAVTLLMVGLCCAARLGDLQQDGNDTPRSIHSGSLDNVPPSLEYAAIQPDRYGGSLI